MKNKRCILQPSTLNTYIDYIKEQIRNPKLPNQIFFDGDMYWEDNRAFRIAGWRTRLQRNYSNGKFNVNLM